MDDKISEAKFRTLQEENAILKKRLAEQQEKMSVEMEDALGDRITSEIKKIRRKGKSTANEIAVVEKHDHKNISLWTKCGKRVGPLHPENAIQTLNRFADIGIFLTSDQPTAKQVADYKETDAYKNAQIKEAARRETKNQSRRSGQMEKLTLEIAKMSGMTVSAINNIMSAREVGKQNDRNLGR